MTATVLIVNAPDAELAVQAWQTADPPADLGWHPNLTLDRPVLPASAVPSLVRPDGTFWPLGPFLCRLSLGRIRCADVWAEWSAQYRRFVDLVGHAPVLVNSHQHVGLFAPCDRALMNVLDDAGVRPYVRRVVEPAWTLWRVPGARLKRVLLTTLGWRAARHAAARGLPGCDWLIGITDPASTANSQFWDRWLRHVGNTGTVELCCHPGYHDPSLVGRDCDEGDGLARRSRETALLRAPSFQVALARAGLNPVRPSELSARRHAVPGQGPGNGRGPSDSVRRAAEL